MSVAAVETYASRTPDAEGWRGIPFRHPRELEAVAQDDGGKHDGARCPRRHRATHSRNRKVEMASSAAPALAGER
ncbi:hypothetical protein ACFC0M_25635 [Streptomyces sp. NPDC056149]|uniref:hypothetical protein n=1 Tax=Streptomyces sp. NPDC056149 TaxID=3345728 RepID=UPI0035DA5BAA